MIDEGLLLIGGGGHCASVLDSVRNQFSRIGIVDRYPGEVLGVSVVGNDDDLPALFMSGYRQAFVTVGSIGDTEPRRRIVDCVKSIGFEMPNIIDKTAAVSEYAELGNGIFVGKRAVVNARAQIADCVIVNSGAIVEHDCTIEAFAHISPGAVLCGNVTVGSDTHVGAGSVVLQGLSIGKGAIVGMGSTITKSVEDNMKVYCRQEYVKKT